MAKKSSEVTELKDELKAKDAALSAARQGLFHIININPVNYQVAPGGTPKLVKAFREAQETAERTVLNISDAEAVNV